MWRALFFAIGIYAIILGVECLVLEKVELGSPAGKTPAANAAYAAGGSGVFQNSVYQTPAASGTAKSRSFRPREWMPWSLIAGGILIVVYTRAYQGASPAG